MAENQAKDNKKKMFYVEPELERGLEVLLIRQLILRITHGSFPEFYSVIYLPDQ